MIERFFATTTAVAEAWRQEVRSRVAVWPDDPVAKAMAHCASELGTHLAQLKRDTKTITVAEFAAARGRSDQTIRAWIRAGLLEAVKGPRGYEIAATARPQLRLHRGQRVA